jgi:hypothetical protein
MADFVIKQHDTYPPLELTLSDQAGAIDLTEAEEIKLYIDRESTVVTGKMEAVDAEKGEVKYEWAVEDLSVVGTFNFEVEITWKSGRVQTVPNGGDLSIEIVDDIGP